MPACRMHACMRAWVPHWCSPDTCTSRPDGPASCACSSCWVPAASWPGEPGLPCAALPGEVWLLYLTRRRSAVWGLQTTERAALSVSPTQQLHTAFPAWGTGYQWHAAHLHPARRPLRFAEKTRLRLSCSPHRPRLWHSPQAQGPQGCALSASSSCEHKIQCAQESQRLAPTALPNACCAAR